MEEIIMTIKARHLNGMRKGVKPYELRKSRPRIKLPVRVLLCVSGTGGKILASFICNEIADATEWDAKVVAKAANITKDEAEEYRRKGKKKLYAWKVDQFYDMRPGCWGMHITHKGLTRPPQSWCYAKGEIKI